MIKLMWFLARKDGVSVEAFHARWRDEHSQIVLRAPGIRAYVQSHCIPEAYDFYDPPFDGMAEIWFDDLETMRAAEASEPWRESGVDSRDFIGKGVRLVTKEFVMRDEWRSPRDRESMVKYVALSTRKRGLSLEAFQTHWRQKHGPLVMAAFPQMTRYVQSHPLSELESGVEPAYDGVPALYFPSLEAFPWGLIKRVGPPPSEPSAAATDAQSLFELPIPGLVTREVAFIE